MLYQLFSVIAPVLTCAVIGYVWRKQGRPYDTSLVTTLVTNIGTPCLVFFTLIDTKIEADAFLTMGAATFTTMVVFYVFYFLFLKAMKLSQKAFLSALAYGNTGNMGLPLCLLAFGDHGLALAIAYFTVNVLCLFTIGVAVPADPLCDPGGAGGHGHGLDRAGPHRQHHAHSLRIDRAAHAHHPRRIAG